MSQGIRKDTGGEKPDEFLVELARTQASSPEGRKAASELFLRYREPVYRWCLSRVRDPELALDLAQDALLSAYRKLSSFRGESRFSSWLFAITRNKCLNALRRPSLFGAVDEVESLPDPRDRPDDELVQREEEERILRLIHQHLSPLDRQVLWLRCFEKVPVDVITQTLRITEASGARGVLQRARRRLRAAMAPQGARAGGNTDEL